MGVAVGDYNGDGRLDLAKTHFADDIPVALPQPRQRLVRGCRGRRGAAVQNRYVEWGAGLPDLDNDGLRDLFYVTGNVYPEIERAAGKGSIRIAARASSSATPAAARFERRHAARAAALTTPHSSRGAAFGDIDNDGDVDVLVMNMNEPPSLLRNEYPGGNALDHVVLERRVVEPIRHRRNRHRHRGGEAAGADRAESVELLLARRSASAFRHWDGARVSSEIEVRWPSGHVQSLKDVDTRRLVTIDER